MRNGNAGQIRVIEAFLAVLIIFSALTVSGNLTVSQNKPSHMDLASSGMNALAAMDSDGMLGRYLDEGNWTALRESLILLLPAGTTFNLTVYNEHLQKIGGATLANGLLDSRIVYFVEYVCASRNPVFSCYVIHLRLGVAS